MSEKDQAVQTGDLLFEAFVEQVKQALEHLYDFAYLQQHDLARIYDSQSDLSAKTAGRQLRYDLMKAIESLKSTAEAHFRAPDARLYNIVHLYYVESLSIQEAAAELGLSERQAYRDLRRGQESVASVLWNNRLPNSESASDFSLQAEMARLKLNIGVIDIGAIFEQAQNAVERLALQQSVQIVVEAPAGPLILSSDPVLAHQVIVSVLSYTIQQAEPGLLNASFEPTSNAAILRLRYQSKPGATSTAITESPIAQLAQRLRWTLSYQPPNQSSAGVSEVELHMHSSSATILVIDDNEGWIALLERFLEGADCPLVAMSGSQDSLRRVQELNPSAIILDVMMPEKDGWELLQRLRTQPGTATTPIIVCTVFNDPQLAYSLGASAFLPKPTSREQILGALRDLDII